jgi:hypothetical protein
VAQTASVMGLGYS